jgi:formate dehydrogenase accessory protein FdhD
MLGAQKHVDVVRWRDGRMSPGVDHAAAESAPTSLAVDLAVKTGVTLLGFVRGGAFNIYAHRERIV